MSKFSLQKTRDVRRRTEDERQTVPSPESKEIAVYFGLNRKAAPHWAPLPLFVGCCRCEEEQRNNPDDKPHVWIASFHSQRRKARLIIW